MKVYTGNDDVSLRDEAINKTDETTANSCTVLTTLQGSK